MMQTARDRIRELRALHDDGLLSLQEFDRRKNAILDAEYAPPGASAVATLPARQGTELGFVAGQEIGPQNRRYRLERLIAMGGMGQVWQATDLATHAELGHSEMVALKILPPQLTQSATHAKLLIEEATQARRLAHENIVRVYEWAQDPATSSYFIIMEYLEGEDLDAYLAAQGRLAPDAIDRLLAPVADALDYAWDKHKLVHRDIKPGNVYLTSHGDVKLLDFGIASRVRNAGSSLGLQTPNAGTVGYRAPEAGTRQRQPARTLDVYAVAVMIYQLLEGRMPFEAMRMADFHPSPPQALNPAQWQVLQQGFAYLAEQRPPSVAALLQALRAAAGPSEEELAAQARQAQEAEQQRKAEQAAAQAAHQERLAQQRAEAEQRRAQAAELAQKREAEARAAAVEKARLEQQRKVLEARQKAEAEAAAQARKQALREQLLARREADAQKAREERAEQQRKAAQLKAEAAYRAEQERHRKQQAERHAAELAALRPTERSPVADANGVLRDRFLDGSGVGPDLVLIPTGRFQMGSHELERAMAIKAGAQKAWLERELPQHWVGIEYSFALGRFPVTVGQWRQFVRATGWESLSDTDWRAPGFAQTDEHPVVGVSWVDAQKYVSWLSAQTGQTYRLPSEAEWEYACRAGTRTAFHMGDSISTEQANYDGNYTYNNGPRGAFLQGTSKLGQFQPNPWGLFDMHGNVWEWTQDVVHDNYDGAPSDGSAWEEGGDKVRRILRGGSWLYNPRYLRSAVRNGFSAVLANDIVGFRVARKLV
ncbi:SUMF1/EgtB/PvdO family nonheme iron enzyme [Duganella qianjiadongensis]|uniref:SUMF1/EgtB/PvdO family nonheme iron enzyme n=1 Tax=Duganella qianjiadongensis TaxID=2692176 RepID=A0ABW9VJH4_9BURK|nr:SUMF1/EgtB/PvdO family nonheme iron enzyme [Duganella qianjiadongensis]MYM37757.1 SUMF1/EgtB/PvdO family nonheme iron enzyme [Duganella qianjiadongensis]